MRREPEQGDAEVRERLRSLAAERRRFGYRRLGILLEREGVSMNKKRLFRLYREEGLAVRRRRGRKRATGTRAPMALPDGPNQRWSLDFVADGLSWGRGGAPEPRGRSAAQLDQLRRTAAPAGAADRLSTPWALTLIEGTEGGHVIAFALFKRQTPWNP